MRPSNPHVEYGAGFIFVCRENTRAMQTCRRLLLAAIVVSTCLPGCVRRRLTVRSNPPGALVYVDDQEIGTTPVSTEFIYYGSRKIQLVKDGYETVTVLQKFSAPWYQYPPLDFVSENLVPRELRDERYVDFQLEPQKVVPTRQLLERADNLRRNMQQGYVTPLPAPIAPTAAPTAPLETLPAPQPPATQLPAPPVFPAP